ncbi:Fatty acid-binding protein [Eumeta japonica]|uniref:Fatty acid-binding protein n=1 Tax=Eumeta variegata TaxID=151549 RepID=A0A4C1SHL2_EUMVA|nr:Fatty acid-binding protein [Eumeta japonica]
MITRTAANAVTPTVELRKDGDDYVLVTSSTFKTTEMKFKPGQEFDEERADGAKGTLIISPYPSVRLSVRSVAQTLSTRRLRSGIDIHINYADEVREYNFEKWFLTEEGKDEGRGCGVGGRADHRNSLDETQKLKLLLYACVLRECGAAQVDYSTARPQVELVYGPVKSVCTFEGNKLKQVQKGGDGIEATYVREFGPEEMKAVMTVKDVVCTRVYKAQ